MESTLFQSEPGVQVLIQSQRPQNEIRGHITLVHGLEGSGESGYMKSISQAGLEAGYAMHRFHMRTCGGTAHLSPTLYHAGMTCDLRAFLERLSREHRQPLFLIGFSLGGNVALKLLGELGKDASNFLTAACAVSTPIDLSASVQRMGRLDNIVYERRFVRRMRRRMVATGRYTQAQLRGIRSLFEIDDRVTAPAFGFKGAEHYYATQSSNQFLERIRIPTLLVQAKDDTFVPFEMFRRPEFETNPHLTLIAPEQGGHLGFISREKPRFWVDGVILDWIAEVTPRGTVPAESPRDEQYDPR